MKTKPEYKPEYLNRFHIFLSWYQNVSAWTFPERQFINISSIHAPYHSLPLFQMQ
jgi:hypothetical protein